MAEAKQKQVERYSRVLPQLEDNEKSLEIFIRKADTLYSLLTTEDGKKLFLKCVKDCTTASTYADIALLESWEAVKLELKSRILPSKTFTQLHSDLTAVKKHPWEPISTFTDKIKKISNDLKDAHRQTDSTATEADWKRIFDMIEIQSLTTFIHGLEPNMKSCVLAKDFKTLKAAETYVKGLEQFVTGTTSLPISTRFNQANQPQQQFCFNCKRSGHIAANCFAQPNNERPICTYCHIQGHTKDRCFKFEAADKCTYCGKTNHNIANCLRKIAEQPQITHMRYEENLEHPTQMYNEPGYCTVDFKGNK